MDIEQLIAQTLQEQARAEEAKRLDAEMQALALELAAIEALGELWGELGSYATLVDADAFFVAWQVKAEALRLAPFMIIGRRERGKREVKVAFQADRNSSGAAIGGAAEFLAGRRAAFDEWRSRKLERECRESAYLLAHVSAGQDEAQGALAQLMAAWPERAVEWEKLFEEWRLRFERECRVKAEQAQAAVDFRAAMDAWRRQFDAVEQRNQAKLWRLRQEIEEIGEPDVWVLDGIAYDPEGEGEVEREFYVLSDEPDEYGYYRSIAGGGRVERLKVKASLLVIHELEAMPKGCWGLYRGNGITLRYPPGFDMSAALQELNLEMLPAMPQDEDGKLDSDDFARIMEEFNVDY